MGNFLSNLASRSFTPVSSIRPRLGSLFEPASALPPAGTALFADVEDETTAPADEPTRLPALPMKRPNEPKSPPRLADSSTQDDLALRNKLEAEPAQRPSSERGSARQRPSADSSNQTLAPVKPEQGTPQAAVLK